MAPLSTKDHPPAELNAVREKSPVYLDQVKEKRERLKSTACNCGKKDFCSYFKHVRCQGKREDLMRGKRTQHTCTILQHTYMKSGNRGKVIYEE